VPTNFTFTLDALIAVQKSQPRVVVGGGTTFAPCVCLAPDPSGPTGGSQAPRPGPYLLIIEAAEQPSGDAQVYGSVCGGGSQPVTCQSDAWTAGFGLSLVRFPVDVPMTQTLRSAWDLRGTLSAYYFDVFEHSLITRWDPLFAEDHGFCDGAWSGRNDTGSVALAMVYLGTDGTALWIDPWLPRRGIVATPGEDWHRTRFGAPTRAASWARIHQFQCMLAESLTVAPLVVNTEFSPLNLLTRGFSHIPPIGFLRVDPAEAQRFVDPKKKPNTGDAALDRVLAAGGAQAGIVSGYVAAARIMAERYFRLTNVLTYSTVALHDDDILEDLSNVFDKDPVQLDVAPEVDPVIERLVEGQNAKAAAGAGWLIDLEAGFLETGFDDLVNRRVEIVKLVVPLQGLVRKHPILGVVPQDAQDQASSWGATVDPATEALSAVGLRQQLGLQMLPRHFVVYVKQRMVLLEVVFVVLELLKYALNTALRANNDAKGASANYASTHQMRSAYLAQPEQNRAVAAAALQHPTVRGAMARVLPLVAPDLAIASHDAAFQRQIELQDAALVGTIPDAATRRQAALDRVADSYAAVYPGFQAVQLLAAIQPADQTEATFGAIGLTATAAGALSLAPSTTVEDVALKDGTPVFASADAAQLYAQLRAAAAEAPVTTLTPKAPATVVIGDVLAKPPADATTLLGGAANYKDFQTHYAANVRKLVAAAQAAVAPPPAGLATRLRAAVTANAGDVAKAVESLRAVKTNDAATTAWLTNAASVVELLGPTRAATAAGVLLKNG
jgi:hypothetical protein